MATRREVIQTATSFMIVAPQAVRGSQANSALTLGLIGCGNRGMYVSGLFAKNEYARVSMICDIYDDRMAEGEKAYSGAAKTKDYRELLASNVDAVLIATPAFLHPEHFEAAVKAKKHIYLEKPAGVDVKGVKRVQAAAKIADPGKRISMGYQQRYGKDYRKAWDLVKSGELGAIKMIRAAWLGNGAPVKTGHPADQEKMRNWYFYRELSGDIIVEQDCHNLDVVNWFMGTHPVKCAGYGSKLMRTIGNAYDNLAVSFQFEGGVNFSYSANQFGRQSMDDVSETFMCEKGWVRTSRRTITISRDPRSAPEVITTVGDITQEAVNQFIEGARTGKVENAAVWGSESTLTALLALEAMVQGREMTWDRLTRG